MGAGWTTRFWQAWLAFAVAAAAQPAHGAARSLTLDDVFDLTRIDRALLSPDGETVAVVVQRPARPGEAYGRTYYELDPGRGDVWLISRRTGERRNLTQGAAATAGYWCPAWSPDGSRLAMLSTRPEGGEPRGGDNVRLYVWTRATGALTRMSDAALMTQTMGGTPMHRVDLRGGADGSTIAHRCSDEENAPFAWLDDSRLLAVMLPPGGVSGFIDASSRPTRHAGEAARALREGTGPTVTAVGSGAEQVPRDERANLALLRAIDVSTGAVATIAAVPTYPFRAELTLSIAPGGRRIAILATTGALPPARAPDSRNRIDSWTVEKRLGFVDLLPGAPIRWPAAPPGMRYPLDLYGWSPDGRAIALRARAGQEEAATPLFVASARDMSIVRVGPEGLSVGGATAGSWFPAERPVFWLDDRRLLARAPGAGEAARADWWLLALDGEAVNLTAALAEPPAELRRARGGGFVAVAGERLLALDAAGRRLAPLPSASLPAATAIAWPIDPGREAPAILVAAPLPDGGRRLDEIPLPGPAAAPRGFTLPRDAQLLDMDAARGIALWREPTPRGLFLRESSLAGGGTRDLLSLNAHLAAIDWGSTMLIDYAGEDGQPLKGAVILPPGYREGRLYPTIVWVYPGYRVRDLNGYFLDPYMAGFYNLRLYAARGYVVLIPSMPRAENGEFLAGLSKGVLPAVDRLVALGIADPGRVGLLGQSFGGYAVYGLVAQSNRFRAGVAMAGITEFTSFYTQFAGSARGYPGIEHEKSWNWALVEAGPLRLGVPPYRDHALYWRNSPLALVDRVETPLLLIHGEHDERAPMAQAESFFYSLYRQGKTARLLRYWGENHGLSQSPANIRDIFEETVRWFDRYLGVGAASP
ncbi:MAG TPA: prolyl oligopeptidase family serine peptidase [Allosphingosinicella sp.]|nr:prolyl oligopeptidase family serine peptidase [Allosphingosinicella sp.]